MAEGPCKNPNCKSHGTPHPNCRCYGGYAKGGEILSRCDSGAAHEKGCPYYADGGDVPIFPNPAPSEDLGAPDPEYKATKQWADSLIGDSKPEGDEIQKDPLGGAILDTAVSLGAAPLAQSMAGTALDALESPIARSFVSDEAGVVHLSGARPKPIYSVMEASESPASPGILQKAQESLKVDSPEAVMNAKGATMKQMAASQSAAGRPLPSAVPSGSFRPKRMAEGGEASAAAIPIATSPAQVSQTLPASTATLPPESTVTQAAAPAQEEGAPNGVPIYDISGEQPVFGHMHPDDVHEAVLSGQYSLPRGSTVPVFSPDGQLGDISAEEAPSAFKNGYKFATPDAIEQHTYGTAAQQALTGLEGAAKGLIGSLAPAIEEATGLTTGKDILAREHANPWTHGLAEAGTLVGGALTGVGEGKLLADAGELAAKVLGPKASTTLAKIGARTISDAAQMVIYQGGNEVSKMIEGDPSQSVGSAAANIGLSGLLGAGTGAVFGSVSPLWKATVGSKVGQLVDDFKGQLNFLRKNPELNEALTKELTDHYTGVTSAADEVYGPQGLKAKSISAALPEMNDGIATHANTVAQDIGAQLEKMKANPNTYPERLTSKLQGDYDRYVAQVSNPNATSSDIFNAGQDLKQQLQGYSKFDKFVKPIDEAYDFVRDSKQMAASLRSSLEDSNVWGKAGVLQQKINKAFTEYLPALKDFESKFTTKVEGQPQIDPGKVQSYLNSLGKPNAEIKKEMLKNFLDASEKYKSVISDAHAALGSESPITASPLSVAHHTLEKMTPGAKLADQFVKHGAAYLAGEGLGTAVGGGLGHLVGAPQAGAIIGERALGPFFSSVLPGIVKPLLEKASDSAAFKAATEYGLAVARGDAQMSRAAKSVFKSVGEVATEASIRSTESSRAKLDAQIQKIQQNPAALTSVGNQVGHYLPDHAAAMAAGAVTAVNYLNSLRPKSSPQRPLDSKVPPDPVAKAKYNRALDIANNPLIVVDAIKSGRLTPGDLATLHAVNPGAYARIAQKLTAEMTNHLNRGETVPYRTRVGLSMFLGQPLDSTFTAQSILAAQPKPEQPQPPTPTTPSSRPKTSTRNLSNISKDARTPGQAREARGVARSD